MLKKLTKIHLTPMLRYLAYSIIVTVLDIAIVWILYRGLSVEIVAANTTGVVSGFIVHYLLSTKTVFQTEFGMKGFIIYLGTFCIGLVLADWLIYAGEHYMFMTFHSNLNFLFSKGISIVIPFFFLYYFRKHLFNMLKKKLSKESHDAL